MTDTHSTTDHAHYAAMFAADARRGAETLADEMVSSAERLRALAKAFTGDQQSPSALAADIVSGYTHCTGAGSTRLWSVVYNAGKAEAHRARIGTRSGGNHVD